MRKVLWFVIGVFAGLLLTLYWISVQIRDNPEQWIYEIDKLEKSPKKSEH